MNVLVTGATSQIGCFLLPALARRGMSAVALSRQPPVGSDTGEVWIRGCLGRDLPEVDVEAVVSCGPLHPLADWLSAGRARGLRRVVATSSMSAESKLASPVAAERDVARSLRSGEARVAEACGQRGIPWTIVRPTLIYGAGLDRSLSPIARRAVRTGVFPYPVAPGLRQPVHAADVADALVRALETPAANGMVLPLGGGERMTVGDMFQRVRRSLPCRTLPVPVPSGLIAFGGPLLPRLRGPLSRLHADLVAENSRIRQVLGIEPRPFTPTAATWGLS